MDWHHTLFVAIDGLVFIGAVMATKSLLQQRGRVPGSCEWEEGELGCWEPSCDATTHCLEGNPAENGFIYCPDCGGKIKEKRMED